MLPVERRYASSTPFPLLPVAPTAFPSRTLIAVGLPTAACDFEDAFQFLRRDAWDLCLVSDQYLSVGAGGETRDAILEEIHNLGLPSRDWILRAMRDERIFRTWPQRQALPGQRSRRLCDGMGVLPGYPDTVHLLIAYLTRHMDRHPERYTERRYQLPQLPPDSLFVGRHSMEDYHRALLAWERYALTRVAESRLSCDLPHTYGLHEVVRLRFHRTEDQEQWAQRVQDERVDGLRARTRNQLWIRRPGRPTQRNRHVDWSLTAMLHNLPMRLDAEGRRQVQRGTRELAQYNAWLVE